MRIEKKSQGTYTKSFTDFELFMLRSLLDMRNQFNQIDVQSMKQYVDQTMASHKALSPLDHPNASVTDAKIGSRTIDDTDQAQTSSGMLSKLLNGIGYVIKAITGEDSWFMNPKTNLDEAHQHMGSDNAGIHGSTANDDPGTLIHRDGNGRAKVKAPDDPLDIANKNYVDNVVGSQEGIDTHVNDSAAGVHGSGYNNAGNSIMHRNLDGRSQVSTPTHLLDAANKQYVDDEVDVAIQHSFNHQVEVNEEVHGSSSVLATNRLIHRDENGQAEVAQPDTNNQIANKAYVDTAINGLDFDHLYARSNASNIIISDTEPSSPSLNDVWIDTSV